MTQYQITLSDEIVHGLFRDDAAMARSLEQVLNQVLQAEVTEALQAKPYQRTEDRRGYRNGFKPRSMTTRIGRLTLAVPQVRDGKFSPELFARFQRSEQALILALMEMAVNGVSTRKVAKITEELCGTEFSRSTVSELCKRLEPLVKAWNERALTEAYPFVMVDAIVLKIRKDGQVRSQSALIAIGVNIKGYREVLGFWIGDSETYAIWREFFLWLKGRGLRGVDIVVSDQHSGLVKAVETQFQCAMWQRCQTPSPATSWTLPQSSCRTTNGIERLNEELRRRERVIRIFPSVESAERLLGALLMEKDEAWSTDRQYFDMRAYLDWKQAQGELTAPAWHSQSQEASQVLHTSHRGAFYRKERT